MTRFNSFVVSSPFGMNLVFNRCSPAAAMNASPAHEQATMDGKIFMRMSTAICVQLFACNYFALSQRSRVATVSQTPKVSRCRKGIPRDLMKGRILLIANLSAAAGCATRRWEKLLVELTSHGVQAHHVITDGPRHAISLSREA